MQVASILQPNRGRKTYQVNCFRDGKLLCRLQCNGDAEAGILSSHWKAGKSMGEMATIMQNMGLKI